MGVHMLGPCVSIIFVAQCAVWVLEFERPEDVFSMIAHVLGVSEFWSLVICASVILLFFQKWLEKFWFIWALDNHLSTYRCLCWAILTSFWSCAFVMNECRFRITPSLVAVGQLVSQ